MKNRLKTTRLGGQKTNQTKGETSTTRDEVAAGEKNFHHTREWILKRICIERINYIKLVSSIDVNFVILLEW